MNDNEIDRRDLLLTSFDHIEEAEGFEAEVTGVLNGSREVPPWANRATWLAYHIETASHHRQRAEEIRAQEQAR